MGALDRELERIEELASMDRWRCAKCARSSASPRDKHATRAGSVVELRNFATYAGSSDSELTRGNTSSSSPSSSRQTKELDWPRGGMRDSGRGTDASANPGARPLTQRRSDARPPSSATTTAHDESTNAGRHSSQACSSKDPFGGATTGSSEVASLPPARPAL